MRAFRRAIEHIAGRSCSLILRVVPSPSSVQVCIFTPARRSHPWTGGHDRFARMQAHRPSPPLLVRVLVQVYARTDLAAQARPVPASLRTAGRRHPAGHASRLLDAAL